MQFQARDGFAEEGDGQVDLAVQEALAQVQVRAFGQKEADARVLFLEGGQ